jgi:hypothetical protein
VSHVRAKKQNEDSVGIATACLPKWKLKNNLEFKVALISPNTALNLSMSNVEPP